MLCLTWRVQPESTAIAGFSMLKWETDNQAFGIHRLVQEVSRERLPDEQRDAILQDVLWIVSNYLPGDPPPDEVRSWPIWETMAAHVEELILKAVEAGIGEPTSHLASMLGMFLAQKSLWTEAEPLMRRALSIDEKSYGSEHPNVARDLNNLAQLLQATNRLGEAEPLMRRTLTILLKFTHETGHLHSDLRVAFENYLDLLKETSLGDEEITGCLAQAGMDAGLDLESFSKLLEQLVEHL